MHPQAHNAGNHYLENEESIARYGLSTHDGGLGSRLNPKLFGTSKRSIAIPKTSHSRSEKGVVAMFSVMERMFESKRHV